MIDRRQQLPEGVLATGYFTTRRFDGAGLGLAIAAELIRGHGGQLELLKSGEDGSEFLIRLPRDIISAPARAPEAEH